MTILPQKPCPNKAKGSRKGVGGRRPKYTPCGSAPVLKVRGSWLTNYFDRARAAGEHLDPQLEADHEQFSRDIIDAFRAAPSKPLWDYLRGNARPRTWREQRHLDREVRDILRDWLNRGWITWDEVRPADLPNELPRVLTSSSNSHVRIVAYGRIRRRRDRTLDISGLQVYIVSLDDGGVDLLLPAEVTSNGRYLRLQWGPITRHMPRLTRYLKRFGLLANHKTKPTQVLLSRLVMAAEGRHHIGQFEVHHRTSANGKLYGGVPSYDCEHLVLQLLDPAMHRAYHRRLGDLHYHNGNAPDLAVSA